MKKAILFACCVSWLAVDTASACGVPNGGEWAMEWKQGPEGVIYIAGTSYRIEVVKDPNRPQYRMVDPDGRISECHTLRFCQEDAEIQACDRAQFEKK